MEDGKPVVANIDANAYIRLDCFHYEAIARDKLREHDGRIYALWDELCDFGSHATDNALRHCLSRVCTWIGAQNAFWIGAVRLANNKRVATDPLLGWRIGAVEVLNHAYASPQRLRSWNRVLHSKDPGAIIRALVSGAGHFRTHSLRTGLVDLDAFKRAASYDDIYRRPGIVDRLWVVFPVNADAESYFCFDAYGPRQPFDDRALRTVGDTFRGIKWFHRELLLSHGLGVCVEPLTPALRRVLHELLSGATERAIAERLHITPASAHQYVKTIFRKFGVHGRAEFMSLWLNSRL